ncbi:MAG: hypothetical protein K6T85_09490, partial [Gorillibacterium sp.]|nr:hypothetical protein [Gorillibacterium sp.]
EVGGKETLDLFVKLFALEEATLEEEAVLREENQQVKNPEDNSSVESWEELDNRQKGIEQIWVMN